MSKNIFEYKNVESVTAWALLDIDGHDVGKVVGQYSESGVVSVSIIVYSEEDGKFSGRVVGKAGGGGYCKFSAAFADCLHKNGYPIAVIANIDSRGKGACVRWLEEEGYQVVKVLE